MSLKSWIVKKMGGEAFDRAIQESVKERLQKAGQERPANLRTGFRRLSERQEKDLEPLKYDQVQRISYYLWMSNPIAHTMLEYNKVYVAGGDIVVKAANPKVQEILDLHWKANQWDINKTKKALELAINGEQIYPVFVNKHTGLVKLGYVDPLNVASVKANDNNPEVKEYVNVRMNIQNAEEQEYKVINEYPSKVVTDEDKYTFLFQVNIASNGTRGNADLLPVADWLDAYSNVVFKFVERSDLLQSFIWDITMKGASEEDINKKLEYLLENKPGAGAFMVHDENETWNQITPDLRARDNIEEARHLRNIVLSGGAYPEFWFAEGENTTRATALMQGAPTFKTLDERQQYFKYMIEHILGFQISQARIANPNYYEDVNDFSFQVIMPELAIQDFSTISTALQALTTSLNLALDSKLITTETAVKVFGNFASKMGVKIDHNEEWKKLSETMSKGDYERLEGMFEKYKKLKERNA